MALGSVKQGAKTLVHRAIPLGLRKRCAVWLDRQAWLPSGKWWATELVRDLAERDVDAYHRFLWAHHLGYAETYDVEQRFGATGIHPTRTMLFEDLEAFYRGSGRSLNGDVRSVFEVGCSLGYLLRHLETGVLEHPERLDGMDIDGRAVEEGSAYLRSRDSIVRLHSADMSGLEGILGAQRYDLFLCCGVLMYTRAEEAGEIVRSMLDHGRIVAISGLAHPDTDNRDLEASAVRERDGTFVHNIDRMVESAGGKILFRRWEGDRVVEGNTIYFLICSREETPA